MYTLYPEGSGEKNDEFCLINSAHVMCAATFISRLGGPRVNLAFEGAAENDAEKSCISSQRVPLLYLLFFT